MGSTQAPNEFFGSFDLTDKIIAFLPDGIWQTFKVTLLSIVFAFILGLITGLGRISRNRIVNRIATIYVEVVRGIPLLVQLFYIYYALGKLVQVPRLVAAVTAMTTRFIGVLPFAMQPARRAIAGCNFRLHSSPKPLPAPD